MASRRKSWHYTLKSHKQISKHLWMDRLMFLSKHVYCWVQDSSYKDWIYLLWTRLWNTKCFSSTCLSQWSNGDLKDGGGILWPWSLFRAGFFLWSHNWLNQNVAIVIVIRYRNICSQNYQISLGCRKDLKWVMSWNSVLGVSIYRS